MTRPRAQDPPVDALEVGLRIAEAFDRSGVSYAIGGALAYGLWGVPRATNDVDVNVFVEPDALGPVLTAIRGLGVDVDPVEAAARAARDGLFVVRCLGRRIDVFTPSIEYAWEAERTRVRHTIEGRSAWFLSAEAVAVFKLLFHRPKDIVDLERLIAVQGSRLDAALVRARLVAMMGEDDERVRTWDRLAAEHSG